MSGVVSELRNIDASLQELKLALEGSANQSNISHILFGNLSIAPGEEVIGPTIDVRNYRQMRILMIGPDGSTQIEQIVTIAGVSAPKKSITAIPNAIRTLEILGEEITFIVYRTPAASTSATISVSVQLIS